MLIANKSLVFGESGLNCPLFGGGQFGQICLEPFGRCRRFNQTLVPGNPFLGQPYGWRSVSNKVNSCSIPEDGGHDKYGDDGGDYGGDDGCDDGDEGDDVVVKG